MKQIRCLFIMLLCLSALTVSVNAASGTYNNGEAVITGTLEQTKYTGKYATSWNDYSNSSKCRDCGSYRNHYTYYYNYDSTQQYGMNGCMVTNDVAMVNGVFYTMRSFSSTGRGYSRDTGNFTQQGNGYQSSYRCSGGTNHYSYSYSYSSNISSTFYETRWDQPCSYTAPGKATLKQATWNGFTIAFGNLPTTINSCNAKGSPAFTGTNVVVKKGTITDIGTTITQFILDEDSESTVAVSGSGNDTTTVTTVKLINPPIIIDWADFPGIDLNVDLNAPTLEVVRNPASTTTPTTSVTLTIRAVDPDGHDHETPISINGGAFQASPATYTVTENQAITIVARDSNGNTRSYVANIENIDVENPEVVSITQSTDKWTRDPVTVTVRATDDVKLHATPYQWEFTPNSNTSNTTTGDWTASRTFRCTENGTLRVQVRDALGKTTWSEPYYIRNIDTISPTATYTSDIAAGSLISKEQGVTVQLNIIDTADPVTMESSGLSQRPVMWDSTTQQWSDSIEHTFHENGTYNIRIKDAVGNLSANIPVTINQISSTEPVIDEYTGDHLRASYVTSPVTLSVTAHAGTGGTLPAKPYSWDGGKTWTSVSTHKVYNNGEYTVMVRDAVGTAVEASLVVSNIDPYVPNANVYLYKGLPSDGSGSGPEDYVWKIRVEADDLGSGIDHIETLWDGGTHTTLPILFDVEEAGVYGVIVYDKAGNQTYAEKVVTNENIGNAVGGGGGASGEYTEIKVPSGGSAGATFNAALQDLIFSKTGAYNKNTGTFTAYPTGQEGISVNIVATPKRNSYTTGYITFNGVQYTIKFGTDDYVTGTGHDINATAFIPISGVTQDMRNGRIKVVLQEWSDNTKTTLTREGSATLYTSTQISDPVVNYTYNRATDKLTLVATSTVAGIKSSTYDLGSGEVNYTDPITVGGAATVKLKVVDNCNNTTSLDLDGTNLPLSGGGGGTLPTEDLTAGSDVTSYHVSNRAADIYIIGGTRGNTNSVPAGDIYSLAG